MNNIQQWNQWRDKNPDVLINLSGANLYGANLYGADLRGADLYDADLSGVDLSGADLSRANLYDASLHGANLSGANLYGANLIGANLRCANLYDASLYGANLRRANLRWANLDGTCLDQANAPNADAEAFCRTPDGRCIGYRTRQSPYVGNIVYHDGETYTAPVFSTANTECHPGLYVAPSPADCPAGHELIEVRFNASDCHHAGAKWRVRRFEVIGKHERNEA